MMDGLTFGSPVLDPVRGVLTASDGQATALRPKTLALAQFLMAQSGRVVTREEILDAVWPDVFVTEDSVTQCVVELRRALGPDGTRLLRTLPRRGYLLDTRIGSGVAMTEPTGNRAEAARLTRQGVAWFHAEGTPAGWLGQRDLFRRAIAADPTYAQAWAWIVFTYTNVISAGASANRTADLRAAEEAANRAVALAPEGANAHAALGSALRVQPDRLEEALAAYRRAVALDSGSHPSRANVGWLLILLGRPAKAEPYLLATLAAAPADHVLRPMWHYYLGVVGLHLGQPGFGADAFRKTWGVSADTRDDCALHLAAALALSGEEPAAAMLVAEVLDRRPDLTLAGLRAEATPSYHPGYLAGRERFFAGLARAGLG